MLKKIFTAFVILIFSASTLTSSAFASNTSINSSKGNFEGLKGIEKEFTVELQEKYDNVGEYLEDNFTEIEISKIEEEYIKEYGTSLDMDQPVSTLALGFWALVLVGALGAIAAEAAFGLGSAAFSWLQKQYQQDGVETNYCGSVKVSGIVFDPSDRSNFIGSGYANDSTKVKALQKYINRAKIGVTLVEDGKYGFATDNAIRVLQGKLGIAKDGIVGTNTWAKMGGKTFNTCL